MFHCQLYPFTKRNMGKKIVLGEGGFGEVILRDGKAVKKFERLRHIIHEYAAAMYLKGCPYIVPVHGADFKRYEMTMELFHGSLSKWLRKERTEQQKLVAFRETLRALVYLYDLSLVHGDIKPG